MSDYLSTRQVKTGDRALGIGNWELVIHISPMPNAQCPMPNAQCPMFNPLRTFIMPVY
ncbi:hypothetical protein F7734_11340 [Scytonema sp. UIC 10036]|uniref:hypothetical protein n=1 Tax=Scytonema sp. UIC 10036 TaxID=2304196 RepID=UPI0012DA04C3|nr:hypothetical protein [Scytonema sp. UIC 10036]MUG92997.1 hypothetical protein [Scytonema sp. UIC 10036]